MWYTHTTGYYSTLKRTEIMSYVTTCKGLKDFILHKVSQIQTDKYFIMQFISTKSS